jgi:hypothetical protein
MSYDPPYSPGQQLNADSLPVVLSIEQQAILNNIAIYLDTVEVLIAAMSAKLPATLGQTTKAGSMSVTLASNQDALPVTDNGGSLTVDAPVASPVPVQIRHRNPTYRIFVPPGASGANKVYFDLFNASGSGKTMRVMSVIPIVSGAVAVTGTLAVNLYLTKTSAVGTGGTAATSDGTDLAAATITEMDSNNTAIPAQVTARLAPSGGATAGAVVSFCSLFTEETNAASYLGHMNDLVCRNRMDFQPVVINQGQGIRVVQGTVASVGNIGFDVVFELE